MKIGHTSIPVNVPTPYTRVGHCDDVRRVSVPVLVSLMSHELAQCLKRSIALWTNIRSFWCLIFTFICCRRDQNWRASQTKRWWCFNSSIRCPNAIHVQGAEILHEPIVKKRLPHRSSTPFKKKRRHRQTLRDRFAYPVVLFENGIRLKRSFIKKGIQNVPEKRRPTRSGTPARNHAGRNLVQVRNAAARRRSSSGRMLPMMSK